MLFLLSFIGCVEYDVRKFEEEPVYQPPAGVPDYSIVEVPVEEPTFEIPPDAYDVLVVLDTSCSMGDDTIIQFGIAQIPNDLNDSESDWQMVMITADPTYGAAWEINPQSTDPEWDAIEGITYLLDSKAPLEKGIDSALNFQSAEPDWFRPEALTLLVIVSDEDDQSDSSPLYLRNEWLYDLEVISVVGLEEDDRNADQDSDYYCSADVAERLLDISDRTVDICTQSRWSIF